jgi:prefoldin subunit 5
MTLTKQLNDILDRLDADESPDAYELAEILKELVSNIELSHAQLNQQIQKLETRIKALEQQVPARITGAKH